MASFYEGSLEGIESCSDSVGMGLKLVQFDELPRVGARFSAQITGTSGSWITTGTVRRCRHIADDDADPEHRTLVGFATQRTTFLLWFKLKEQE